MVMVLTLWSFSRIPHEKWYDMLQSIIVDWVLLPDIELYTDIEGRPYPKPSWRTCVAIVDASLSPQPPLVASVEVECPIIAITPPEPESTIVVDVPNWPKRSARKRSMAPSLTYEAVDIISLLD